MASEAVPEAVAQAVAEAVGGGYCRLQMPLKLPLAVRETVAGRPEGGEGEGYLPPFECIPAWAEQTRFRPGQGGRVTQGAPKGLRRKNAPKFVSEYETWFFH